MHLDRAPVTTWDHLLLNMLQHGITCCSTCYNMGSPVAQHVTTWDHLLLNMLQHGITCYSTCAHSHTHTHTYAHFDAPQAQRAQALVPANSGTLSYQPNPNIAAPRRQASDSNLSYHSASGLGAPKATPWKKLKETFRCAVEGELPIAWRCTVGKAAIVLQVCSERSCDRPSGAQ